MDELFEKLKKVIVDNLDIDADKVTMEATFRGDLGLDSLETYELMYSLEAETGVKVPDEVAATFVKVQDVYDYIKKQGN